MVDGSFSASSAWLPWDLQQVVVLCSSEKETATHAKMSRHQQGCLRLPFLSGFSSTQMTEPFLPCACLQQRAPPSRSKEGVITKLRRNEDTPMQYTAAQRERASEVVHGSQFTGPKFYDENRAGATHTTKRTPR